MNKLLTKTVKKVTLLSVILAVILALSIVVTAIFGIHYAATADDSKTMTVTMSSFYYNDEKSLDKIEDTCEKKMGGLKARYQQNGYMSGDECEIVYVFDADVSDAKMEELEKTLQAAFDADMPNANIWVRYHSETLETNIPLSYFMRALGAVGLFTLLAFVYVTVRYRLHMGIVAAACSLLAAIMTAAIVFLTRIPFATSALYVIALASLMTTVMTMFTLNKIRANKKSGEYEGKSDEEFVVASVATKETLVFAAAMGVALVLVGAIAISVVSWFAVTAFVSLLVSTFVAWLFAPAMYLPLKGWADKKSEAKAAGYVGAKKTSTKQKRVKAPKAEVKEEAKAEVAAEAESEPATEAPVEVATEVPVEEAEESVEETVADVAEESVEEAPVEETPVEDAAADVAEEETAE